MSQDKPSISLIGQTDFASEGYSKHEANARLRRNHGVVASFSRALVEGLTAQQSQAKFNARLDGAVQSIFEASTVKQAPRNRITAERKIIKAAAQTDCQRR